MSFTQYISDISKRTDLDEQINYNVDEQINYNVDEELDKKVHGEYKSKVHGEYKSQENKEKNKEENHEIICSIFHDSIITLLDSRYKKGGPKYYAKFIAQLYKNWVISESEFEKELLQNTFEVVPVEKHYYVLELIGNEKDTVNENVKNNDSDNQKKLNDPSKKYRILKESDFFDTNIAFLKSCYDIGGLEYYAKFIVELYKIYSASNSKFIFKLFVNSYFIINCEEKETLLLELIRKEFKNQQICKLPEYSLSKNCMMPITLSYCINMLSKLTLNQIPQTWKI